MPAITLVERRELPFENGKKAVPRCGTEPERRPDYIAGARLLRRLHQPSQTGPVVGDSWNDGGYNEPRMNPTLGEPPECPKPRRRHWRAELQPACQPRVRRGQRDIDAELIALRNRLKKIEITSNERRFGDDLDGQTVIRAQHLQDSAGEPEPPLGGLVGIGGGADDQ